MTTNGYKDKNLVAGPDNSWFGYYSLTQQNKTDHLSMSFAKFIKKNAPVTFTDPKVSKYYLNSCRIYANTICLKSH